MRGPDPDRRGSAAALLAAALLLTAPAALAQRLPFRHYGVRDGLPHDRVTRVLQDRKGYLWFATPEGLSRFDGYRFVNYGMAEGLPNRRVNVIAEDREGRLWVGTNGGGVSRLLDDPPARGAGRGKFQSYRVGDTEFSERVNACTFDADDTLWCATDQGLYRAARGAGDARAFEAVVRRPDMANAMAALSDGKGRVWLALIQEVFAFTRAGTQAYTEADGVGRHSIRGLAEDASGRVFLVNERELYRFEEPGDGQARGRWRRQPLAVVPEQKLLGIRADAAGTLWISSTHGLIRVKDGQQTVYGAAEGLSDDHVRDVVEDREGNLWVTTWLGGVNVLSGEGIVSYTTSEGLPHRNVLRVLRDRAGRVYAQTEFGGVAEVAGGRARPVAGTEVRPFVGSDSTQLRQDSRGDWWLGSHQGLFRLPGPELRPATRRRMGPAEGIPDGTRFQGQSSGIYEDPRGALWCAGTGALYRLDPGRGRQARFERVPLSPPFVKGDVIREMTSDAAGHLWLSSFRDVGRLVDGRLELVTETGGLPAFDGGTLLLDRRGWLWIGHRVHGLSVSRDPTAARPTFTRYSTADGLASDSVESVAEDEAGRIWVATAGGLDQLDPATGRLRHFGSADGLAADFVHHLLWDPAGELWVATANGLSCLSPGHERRGRPLAPPVYLTRIRVAGEEQPLPETGARTVPALQLPVGSNNLLLEYVGLSFFAGRPLRYQYRLQGLDADWSPLTEMTAVNYARLPAGSYRFAVRATTAEGLASAEEAAFSFSIPPPFWQRGWFLAGVVGLAAAAVILAHRARVRRLLALEAIRRQIATDLHDEMGAGLSQVAILSEVARRDSGATAADLLGEIAQLARDMRESMADIVWAIDPRKDRLEDLVRRMRQLTFNLLERDGLQVQFLSPPDGALSGIALAPDRRRHLLLVFKEAIHNVARHARASEVRVRLDLQPRGLRLAVHDNGVGFDPAAPGDGHGLGSLRDRAARLSAELRLDSKPGQGTSMELDVPLP